MNSTIKLNDGHDIPLFGLGTYKIVEQADVNKAVDAALGAGYRLFDTAKYYLNEPQLGIALKVKTFINFNCFSFKI